MVVDANRRLILDSVEKNHFFLSEIVLCLSGGDNARNVLVDCALRLVNPKNA